MILTSWSGGKDSTASLLLEHKLGLEPSDVIFSEVMFDIKNNISGENPEHIEWIYTKAVPRLESMGHKVHIVRADTDYLRLFFAVTKRSKMAERNGKLRGFPLAGLCILNDRCKVKPIKYFLKVNKPKEHRIGIACDEPKRAERRTERLLLVENHITEKEAFEMCKKEDFLFPIYERSYRGGCWFCPNCRPKEFAGLKKRHFGLYKKLLELDDVENRVSDIFSYGRSFKEIDKQVQEIIDLENFHNAQLSII